MSFVSDRCREFRPDQIQSWRNPLPLTAKVQSSLSNNFLYRGPSILFRVPDIKLHRFSVALEAAQRSHHKFRNYLHRVYKLQMVSLKKLHEVTSTWSSHWKYVTKYSTFSWSAYFYFHPVSCCRTSKNFLYFPFWMGSTRSTLHLCFWFLIHEHFVFSFDITKQCTLNIHQHHACTKIRIIYLRRTWQSRSDKTKAVDDGPPSFWND